MFQNKLEKRNLFIERYLNKKVKIVSKFLENGKDFFVYEGIITGIDSNFIYLSNASILKNGKDKLGEYQNIALNKSLVSYVCGGSNEPSNLLKSIV
jgi:hypothetical protein